RYPVKSMAGERLEFANVGWYGIDGDRRLALRRTQAQNDFPWLTATTLPELLQFNPFRREADGEGDIPTHVRTPEGKEMPVFGEELAADIERRHGAPVQMMHMRNGIFDDGSISVIATDTVREIGRSAGIDPDARRFRPNIVVRLLRPNPFEEEKWLGGVLSFGETGEGARVSVTARDVRCSMINYDPDSGRSTPEVLKSVVRINQNNAGIYGTVIRTGRLSIGQTVSLQESSE
ncbi:MAG: MOSC domain-containing protein, partial [Gemmatimonadales bacterium]